MHNDWPMREMSRIVEESLSDKGPAEIDQNLLADLFDLVFGIYREFRGTPDTVGPDRYVDRKRILAVVNAAIDRAEIGAVCSWREHWQEREKEHNRNVNNHTQE